MRSHCGTDIATEFSLLPRAGRDEKPILMHIIRTQLTIILAYWATDGIKKKTRSRFFPNRGASDASQIAYSFSH